MRTRKALFLAAVLACTMGQMCGAPTPAPPPDCLEIEDVIDIGAGTATGTAFSGTYRGLSAVVDSCIQCPGNTIPEAQCNAPTFSGHLFTIAQNGGILTLDGPEASLAGQVNSDGTFLIGGISGPTRDDGVKTGQVLMLMDGRFTGVLIVATMEVRITGQAPDGRTGDTGQSVSISMSRVD